MTFVCPNDPRRRDSLRNEIRLVGGCSVSDSLEHHSGWCGGRKTAGLASGGREDCSDASLLTQVKQAGRGEGAARVERGAHDPRRRDLLRNQMRVTSLLCVILGVRYAIVASTKLYRSIKPTHQMTKR